MVFNNGTRTVRHDRAVATTVSLTPLLLAGFCRQAAQRRGHPFSEHANAHWDAGQRRRKKRRSAQSAVPYMPGTSMRRCARRGLVDVLRASDLRRCAGSARSIRAGAGGLPGG